jgi:protein-disulfide isomerase
MTSEQRTQLWVAGIFLGAIALITIIAAATSSGGTPATNTTFKATQTTPVTQSDHARGNAAAKVTLIEYGDFECPACGAYEPLIQQLYKKYGDKVQFIFRNFPLYQIHPNAEIAADAAEAAGTMGKYWEMHDLLYTKQTEWSTAANSSIVSKYFDSYAQSIGVDTAAFDAAIASTAVKNKVSSDAALGNAAKIDHTPTFFINLTQIVNPTSLAGFETVLNAAIASSTGQ